MLSHQDDEHWNNFLTERIRQARQSFNLTLVLTTATAAMTLLGTGLLLSRHVSAGIATTAGGGSLTICCFKLAKDANDRLDKVTTQMKEKDEGKETR